MKKAVRLEDDFLILDPFFEYPIELDRIDTPEKAQWWLDHLGGKVWFSADMKTDMINLLRRHFGYELGDIARTA